MRKHILEKKTFSKRRNEENRCFDDNLKTNEENLAWFDKAVITGNIIVFSIPDLPLLKIHPLEEESDIFQRKLQPLGVLVSEKRNLFQIVFKSTVC